MTQPNQAHTNLLRRLLILHDMYQNRVYARPVQLMRHDTAAWNVANELINSFRPVKLT